MIFCSLNNKLRCRNQAFDYLFEVENTLHNSFANITQHFSPTPFILLKFWQIWALVSDYMQKSTQHSPNELCRSSWSLNFAEFVHQTVVDLVDYIKCCRIEGSSRVTTRFWLSRLIISGLKLCRCKFRVTILSRDYYWRFPDQSLCVNWRFVCWPTYAWWSRLWLSTNWRYFGETIRRNRWFFYCASQWWSSKLCWVGLENWGVVKSLARWVVGLFLKINLSVSCVWRLLKVGSIFRDWRWFAHTCYHRLI